MVHHLPRDGVLPADCRHRCAVEVAASGVSVTISQRDARLSTVDVSRCASHDMETKLS